MPPGAAPSAMEPVTRLVVVSMTFTTSPEELAA